MVTLHPSPAPSRRLFRVEMLGVFGSGKTTLAKRIAGTGAEFLAEDHDRNPFWPNSDVGLPYDLSFLLQHLSLVHGARGDSPGPAICDWSFVSDRLWASMRRSTDEAFLEAIWERVLRGVAEPIGYLYLPRSTSLVVKRLQERGRPSERDLGPDIEAAAAHLDRLVRTLPAGRTMEVADDHDIDDVVAQMAEWRSNAAHG